MVLYHTRLKHWDHVAIATTFTPFTPTDAGGLSFGTSCANYADATADATLGLGISILSSSVSFSIFADISLTISD
jgi:hypothetical protein